MVCLLGFVAYKELFIQLLVCTASTKPKVGSIVIPNQPALGTCADWFATISSRLRITQFNEGTTFSSRLVSSFHTILDSRLRSQQGGADSSLRQSRSRNSQMCL